MSLSRRNFLELTLKSAVIIGAGNTLQSFTGKGFTLPPAKDVLLRFALVSDAHYGQPNTDFDFHHDNMVGWLNKENEERGIEFTFINGDLFHNNPTFLLLAKKKWQGLKMPYYVSHGNHDQVDGDTWQKTWGMPLNYTFEKGKDIAFIVLDTATPQGDYMCADVNWAKQQFEKYAHKKHVLVIMHIAPFKEIGGGIACPAIVDLFKQQPNLRACFHGHDHNLDDAKEIEGKYHFWDCHIAGDWGTQYRGYRIVEVMKNGDILTYQVNAANDTRINENTLAV